MEPWEVILLVVVPSLRVLFPRKWCEVYKFSFCV